MKTDHHNSFYYDMQYSYAEMILADAHYCRTAKATATNCGMLITTAISTWIPSIPIAGTSFVETLRTGTVIAAFNNSFLGVRQR